MKERHISTVIFNRVVDLSPSLISWTGRLLCLTENKYESERNSNDISEVTVSNGSRIGWSFALIQVQVYEGQLFAIA